MEKLILMVGIPGSGKSSFAQKLCDENGNAVVVSSDQVRFDLFGDENVQDRNVEVFAKVDAMVRQNLKSGKTVIVDATNINRKSRRGFTAMAKHMRDVSVECHVLLCPVEQALKNMENRERKVGRFDVERQMKKFQMPEAWEGIDKIYYHNLWKEDGLLERLSAKMWDLDQTCAWHKEDAGLHTELVVNATKRAGLNEGIIEAAWFHDIGKLFTRTEDERGAHFYDHDHVSTYMYLLGTANEGELDEHTLYVARLIENHDRVRRKEFHANTFIKQYGRELYEDVKALAECDVAGSISERDYRDMPLLELVNTFSDWRERLTAAPFSIRISDDGPYVLFKYNMLASDMAYRAVRESRGSILKKNADGTLTYVCRPFDKFFNYGEPCAAHIDWTTARVTEKVDGSLMKCWYDDGRWHLSTNGIIDAAKAQISDMELSFMDVFERAAGVDLQEFCKEFCKDRTYMFELTSRETRIVIEYGDGIYYLSSRETGSGKEIFDRPVFSGKASVKFPRLYSMDNLDDVLSVVGGMSKDEEGVVVNDAKGKRIKVKSPEYLVSAHLRMNGLVTDKRLIEYIRNGTVDDFIAYVPQERERVEDMMRKIDAFCVEAEAAWEKYKDMVSKDRKEFARSVPASPFKAYVFFRADRTDADPRDYLLGLSNRQVLESIRKY